MSSDLDIRLLRHFVALAAELHFGRAARGLFVTQQALSRDLRRLEDRVGVTLVERTTRRVALTPMGERLLPKARQLLRLHDDMLRELQDAEAGVLVNVVGQGLTPTEVLAAARRSDPATEFFARFHGGLDIAVPLLLTHRLDLTFGRWAGPAAESSAGIEQQLVRFEPITLLLPLRHPLAGRSGVSFADLRGLPVCWLAGDHVTAEWEDTARQLLAATGAADDSAATHPYVRGLDELAHHLRTRDSPALTLSSQPAVPGTVVRPLVEPGALFPWSLAWRRSDRDRSGVRALRSAAAALGATANWTTVAPGAWLPQPEARRLTTRSGQSG